MILISRRRRHHDPPARQRPQGVKIGGERANLFLAGELKQELGPGRQGLQRLAAEGSPIGRIQLKRSQRDTREVEPDPALFAPGHQLAAASREADGLIFGHRPRLPQHMGRRQGAMAAQVHLHLRSEPAQPVMPLPQLGQKGALREVELRCHGLQLGVEPRFPQHHHGGVASEGVMAEGVDMIETGHGCSLGHERSPGQGARQGHFYITGAPGLRWILAL